MRKWLLFGLAIIAVLSLATFVMGCGPIPDKATGGGFLKDRCGNKVTFGFNVQDAGDWCAKGQLQLVDHEEGYRIHGNFSAFSWSFFGGAVAWGECTINGEGPYDFCMYVEDEGEPGVDDYFKVTIEVPGPDLRYRGVLDGGNIQLHYPKVK